VYQIELNDDGSVELKVYGGRVGGNTSTTMYASEANMPNELRAKVSALKMVTPPDGYEDIGQRVNETVFWVFE
jgi:hypothetical protein